ncbi:MAG: hypothetical protein VB050_03905 [Geobacteraceae bacterium]|nr:hypothetical protein [Geobacteraceae bacterium]
MRILLPVVTVVAMLLCAAPGPVIAASLDTQGKGVAIKCGAPFMEDHSISADGKSSFRFHGQCSYSQGKNAWNKHYIVKGTWDGTLAKEVVTILGENKYGNVVSSCPSDPWLNKVSCQKKSLSGKAFEDYQISGATSYPLTANVLSDAKKAELRAELAEKKKQSMCTIPVIVSPSPATGQILHPPAAVKIEIKHAALNPPKEMTIYWTPPTKQGEWPAAAQKQNMKLSNLKTSGGVTTGTLNTSKLGTWEVTVRTALPSYCNKGNEVIQSIRFTVKEKSAQEIMVEKSLKEKKYKAINGKIPAPGPGPGPDPILKQQQLQQQKPM